MSYSAVLPRPRQHRHGQRVVRESPPTARVSRSASLSRSHCTNAWLTLVALGRLDACTGAGTPREVDDEAVAILARLGVDVVPEISFVPTSHAGGRRTASA